jgi:hypothetical protein
MNLDKGTLLERNIENYPSELCVKLQCIEDYAGFRKNQGYDAISIDREHNGNPDYFVWVISSYCQHMSNARANRYFKVESAVN